MCGIAGFWVSDVAAEQAVSSLTAMTEAIRSRGPDDVGAWFDHGAGIGLGHRRLSIIDLSHAGHQPMASPCGRFVLVFNGEIYNHRAVREKLAGHVDHWRGNSDTEALLNALIHFGPRDALQYLNGMFAFAFLDRLHASDEEEDLRPRIFRTRPRICFAAQSPVQLTRVAASGQPGGVGALSEAWLRARSLDDLRGCLEVTTGSLSGDQRQR